MSRRGSSLSSRDSRQNRRGDGRLRLAIDQLENRLALSLPGEFSIGGITSGQFLDAPSGLASVSDQVLVSISGTKGTVRFNDGLGVEDGFDIQTIEILDASSDFQLTFGANVRTTTPVAYGSDGIIQLGQITANTVIRGINTVKGPATDVATSPFPALDFTWDTDPTQVIVAGDQTALFDGEFVSLTITTPTAVPTFFDEVVAVSYDGTDDETTITLERVVGSGVSGLITLAAEVEPSFVLTSFEGVNFSRGGGLFVDVVEGRDSDNVGIVTSGGLISGATITVRDTLDAVVQLGTTSRARADGRVFIESATEDSAILVARSGGSTSRNSQFQLIGGFGEFAADVTFAGTFSGVVNVPGGATGDFWFQRGVGRGAVLEASVWESVRSDGDFAGTINQLSFGGLLGFDAGLNLLLNGGNLTKSARVNGSGLILLDVDGSIAKGAQVSSTTGVAFVARNLSGTIEAGVAIEGEVTGNVSGARLAVGGVLVPLAPPDFELFGGAIELLVRGNVSNSSFSAGEMLVEVEGSVLKGSSFTGGGLGLQVERNFDGTVNVGSLEFLVGGNVSRASRIVALAVEDFVPLGFTSTSALGPFEQHFRVGGRFDGILNVTYFQAYSGEYLEGETVAEVIGGGVGKSGRLNIGYFGNQYDDDTDTVVPQSLVFAGNFQGNLRVLGDLEANLGFLGNVNFIVIGGEVLSAIYVEGRLSSLTSGSYFSPDGLGGEFRDAAAVPTGTLLTVGGYKTVTPLAPLPPV